MACANCIVPRVEIEQLKSKCPVQTNVIEQLRMEKRILEQEVERIRKKEERKEKAHPLKSSQRRGGSRHWSPKQSFQLLSLVLNAGYLNVIRSDIIIVQHICDNTGVEFMEPVSNVERMDVIVLLERSCF